MKKSSNWPITKADTDFLNCKRCLPFCTLELFFSYLLLEESNALEPVSNWSNIYYLHFAVNFDATKLLQIFVQT